MTKGANTRSGLLWEVERLLNEVENLPQILLMENVPQVHAEKNQADFFNWVQFLNRKGYTSYFQDLNAKDYGVAQNRERCFMLSFLGEWDFDFPAAVKLNTAMNDYLEEKVDEKYYINTEKAQKLIATLIAQNANEERESIDLCLQNPRRIKIANCIKARYDAGISNLQKDGSGVIEICNRRD